MLLGLPFLALQARQSLDDEATAIQQFVLARIEAILGHAGDATADVLDLVGSPCVSAGLDLRRGVTAHPFVRSLNLAENGRIYCSTLEGAVDYAEDSSAYANGRLQLMFGNLVTPNRALLVYRQATKTGAVLVGIDGQHVFDVLRLGAEEFVAQVRVGENWVDKDGTVTAAAHWPDSATVNLASSVTYPFTVGVAYRQSLVCRHLISAYWPSWLLLTLLGLLMAYGGHRVLSRRNSLTTELHRAVEAGEFVPFYQPVVQGGSGELAGAEVLVRWMHPVEGLIPPNQFIPLAESSGLIVKMTNQLMDKVQADLLGQVKNLPERFHIGFNISAAHCRSMELLERCRDFLKPFPPASIVLFLELTEREIIQATPLTDELFKQLDNIGVQVALDDFGTGNSSLEYLQRFTVNALKIDQSFVAKADSDALSTHILDIIVDLASRLDLFVVAEGVENAMQRAYLEKRGVEYMQGYLFGRPVPFADFIAAHVAPTSK
ncbi:cyclic diguanylate phosphodiesterase [Shinella curvata]|uniref:cyclic-guanylate-specific phosphodiesterase n=1 Tax=Shinella curvata TaxID=1817964 RepID=A0ABT8XL72_9HYPH|nr:cyclic diguanylate phosphodiesterase [Shinella curvata]MCJ8056705.1 cyclic diguanylate phosphodiesterase [Shinella curvata]MDO6124455.1 cyclic diguanylate phosphodiesterase [Shinella curvata]